MPGDRAFESANVQAPLAEERAASVPSDALRFAPGTDIFKPLAWASSHVPVIEGGLCSPEKMAMVGGVCSTIVAAVESALALSETVGDAGAVVSWAMGVGIAVALDGVASAITIAAAAVAVEIFPAESVASRVTS